jgi:hypothetical protein
MTIDYGKLTDQYMRENPADPAEEALADELADREIKKFLERIKGKNFSKRAIERLLQQVETEKPRPVDEEDHDEIIRREFKEFRNSLL